MLAQISSEMRTAITLLGLVCLVLMLVLATLLMRKYIQRKKPSVKYLAVAFLLFVSGLLSAMPVYFNEIYALDKIYYAIGKSIAVLAVIFFFKFTVEVFATSEEGKTARTWFQVLFIAINMTLLWIYTALEIYSSITFDVRHRFAFIQVIQGLFVCTPFFWMAAASFRLSKRMEEGTSKTVERTAVMLIGASGVFMAGFFLFNAINEGLGVANLWTLPAWASAIVAAILFYMGVHIPQRRS